MKRTNKILVVSLDMDNCVLPQNSKDSSPADIFDANLDFFSKLAAEIKSGKYYKAILLMGSIRQDQSINRHNIERSNTLCAFDFITYIEDRLKRELEEFCAIEYYPLLLADLLHSSPTPIGYHFTQRASTPYCVIDPYKRNLLYAQIHHIAAKYRTSKIVFRFYDDCTPLLHALKDFFSTTFSFKNKKQSTLSKLCCFWDNACTTNLVPQNITLEIYKKDFLSTPSLITKITGQGNIDDALKKNLTIFSRHIDYTVNYMRSNALKCLPTKALRQNNHVIAADLFFYRYHYLSETSALLHPEQSSTCRYTSI